MNTAYWFLVWAVKPTHRFYKICAAYVPIAFLTGAAYWNAWKDGGGIAVGFDAVLAGMVWPVYWFGRFAIWITS